MKCETDTPIIQTNENWRKESLEKCSQVSTAITRFEDWPTYHIIVVVFRMAATIERRNNNNIVFPGYSENRSASGLGRSTYYNNNNNMFYRPR